MTLAVVRIVCRVGSLTSQMICTVYDDDCIVLTLTAPYLTLLRDRSFTYLSDDANLGLIQLSHLSLFPSLSFPPPIAQDDCCKTEDKASEKVTVSSAH